MKLRHHKDLTLEKWAKYCLPEQLANIGSEVIRTLHWQETDKPQAKLAFERSLELFDLTKATKLPLPKLKEVARLREAWTDFIAGDNVYQTNSTMWEREFMHYTFLARKHT